MSFIIYQSIEMVERKKKIDIFEYLELINFKL